jgi:hypothetical protein
MNRRILLPFARRGREGGLLLFGRLVHEVNLNRRRSSSTIIVVFLIAQRRFIEALTSGTIKG